MLRLRNLRRSDMRHASVLQRCAPAAPLLLLLAALAFGFSLGRYPSFYVDDAFFVFPALRYATGGSLTYAVSLHAPFSNDLWAYHGPILPSLLAALFRVFGYGTALSRLPNYLCGWVAPMLIAGYLHRRGYHYAGLVLAVLWCGDRAPQEIMYARMDGIALLVLVCAFLALVHTLESDSGASAFAAGFLCATTALLNPMCVLFSAVSLGLLALKRAIRQALFFTAGLLLLLPWVYLLWHGKMGVGLRQLVWHIHKLQSPQMSAGFVHMLSVLRWSRYWVVGLIVFAVAAGIVAAQRLWHGGLPNTHTAVDLLCSAAFGLTGLAGLCRGSTRPYYIVYFSLWVLVSIAVLAETEWKRMRGPLAALCVLWIASAAWNGLRLRESLLFHRALSRDALNAMITQDVPHDAVVATTPELFDVPLRAGHNKFLLTTWFEESQDICPTCYLLMTRPEYNDTEYVSKENLAARKLVYSGPAFPGAGQLAYPVVLLSPEITRTSFPVGSAR